MVVQLASGSSQPHVEPIAPTDSVSEVKAGRTTPAASVLFDEGGKSFPEIIRLKSST